MKTIKSFLEMVLFVLLFIPAIIILDWLAWRWEGLERLWEYLYCRFIETPWRRRWRQDRLRLRRNGRG